MKCLALFFACCAFGTIQTSAPGGKHATEITIRLLDSHSGKPVPYTEVHVYKNRRDVIDLETDQYGVAQLNPPSDLDRFLIGAQESGAGGWGLVHCDFDKHHPVEAAYLTADVLRIGIAAPNHCSHRKAPAMPGEFVLFVRTQTLWEKFQS